LIEIISLSLKPVVLCFLLTSA